MTGERFGENFHTTNERQNRDNDVAGRLASTTSFRGKFCSPAATKPLPTYTYYREAERVFHHAERPAATDRDYVQTTQRDGNVPFGLHHRFSFQRAEPFGAAHLLLQVSLPVQSSAAAGCCAEASSKSHYGTGQGPRG